MKIKVTFSRAITIIVLLEMTALLPICVLTAQYPPTSFTICWTGFWIAVELAATTLKKDKRKHNKEQSIIDAVLTTAEKNNISVSDIVDIYAKMKEVSR